MDICSQSCLSVWQFVKNFSTGHCMQIVQPIFFIPALHIGNIDFYHFVPLSLTLTLLRGQGSAQSTHFSAEQSEICCGDETIQAEYSETTFE